MRMAEQHLAQRLEFGPIIGGARRVRGRIQDQPSRPRRDRSLERRRGQFEADVLGAGHDDRLAVIGDHHVGI